MSDTLNHDIIVKKVKGDGFLLNNKLDENNLKSIFKGIEIRNKDRIISFLCLYSHNEFIYESVIKRNCKLTKEEIAYLLDKLIENDVVEKQFNYVCPICSQRIYNLEIPEDEELWCPNCDTKIAKIKEYYYKVK